MIYDCFTFYNELDLLEIRLHELDGIVDRFVLVEASLTFSGAPKRLFYQENKRRFSRWQPKIIAVTVDDMPRSDDAWALEGHQRDAITRGLHGCKPEDTILVSDVDEIPSAKRVTQACASAGLQVFEQTLYYYYLNNLMDYPWPGTRAASYEVLQNIGGPQAARRMEGPRIADGGWHFSFLGGVHEIRNKLRAYSHREYSSDDYTRVDRISRFIQDRADLFEREYKSSVVEVNKLPAYIQDNRERFYDWFYADPPFREDWCNDAQCAFLCETYNRVKDLNGDVIEVGCWEGRSTVALANVCYPQSVFAVDTWQGNVDEAADHVTVQILKQRDVFRDFIRNIRMMTGGNVQLIVAHSRDFFRHHVNSIKFCHIDGSHDYESVRNDILGALAWTIPGGILCGDDFAPDAPGVMRAVQELLPGYQQVHRFWHWQRP